MSLRRFWEREESFSRKYRLKTLGYALEKAIERVSMLLQVDKEYITGKGRQKDRVRARDVVCYWAANELGISMVDLARKFDMTLSAAGYACMRGEKMAKERGCQLAAGII